METMIRSNQSKLISMMPQVKKYETKLDSLADWWGKVALIGKINSHSLASIILDDMQCTKEKFAELHRKLIDNLLLEHLKKVIVDNTAKSQVTIDILIRNLFERTADVGFLATDENIRQFLGESDADNNARLLIESRLSEYVQKYSVYDEIVVLDPQGNVRANLDQSNNISFSKHDLIQKTLTSNDDYVETFCRCDLQPQKAKSLIYSCKITASNDPDSVVLGVLCLCFRFDDEMNSIFNNLSDGSDSALLLMSKQGDVIASSQPSLVPLNTHFTFSQTPQLLLYQESEFLVTSCQSNGYQSFYGLGWWAMIMTPVQSAFHQTGETLEHINRDDDLHASQLFSKALKEIHQASKVVNDDLSLVVLNGQITALRQEAAEFMPVLEAIKQIGINTASIFSDSISDLQTTVISSHMSDVAFMAALAVNIMDRNLYERANDCRWWALTSAFRQVLAQDVIDADDQQRLSTILNYINNLYTVYSNLYLFDSSGQIVAVSDPTQKSLIGQRLDSQTGATAALTLTDSQQYTVSPFVTSYLYGNKHTYIYNATITAPETQRAVGGIGIVFDSEPEFVAMLTDTLPKDEHGKVPDSCFAVFAERTGNIIAATEKSPYCIGEQLSLDAHLFTIEQGEKLSEIHLLQGVQYILGVAASSGYREYKTTGDYENDILAFIFIPT